VTEWCKKESCWEGLLKQRPPALPDLAQTFVTGSSRKRYDAASDSEAENTRFCKEKGENAWFALSKWLKERDFMQGKQRSQCFNMGRAIKSEKGPSAVLSAACRSIWNKAEEGYGWRPESTQNGEQT